MNEERSPTTSERKCSGCHKPRYHRDYRLTAHDVPVWAVLAVVDFLREEAEKFGYDLELPVAEVTVGLSHTSVLEDDDEALMPFWKHLNTLWLSASYELLEVRKGKSVAEVEEEEAKKSR